MNILLVEDDEFKQTLIVDHLRAQLSDIKIEVSRSVQNAVQRLRNNCFDLIVLDMALPSHNSKRGGAEPISQPSGGLEVLLELSYEKRPERVVIVTQYPEIEYDGKLYPLKRALGVFQRKMAADIADIVHFEPEGTEWRQRITKALR